MIHPHTKVMTCQPVIGVGVFATQFIPKGTIVVVRDRFDTCLTREEFLCLPDPVRESMETYLYHDRRGNLILSWDHARYMNHSCCSNTMMTDYNLEIAVRDIEPGQELTTEYGLLNIQDPYALQCGCEGCREHLRLDDIDVHAETWDALIRASLMHINECPQPLFDLLDHESRSRIDALLLRMEAYSSIRNLKWREAPACAAAGV